MALSIDWTGLSPDSKRSLELQGEIYSQEEADAFIARPHVFEAVQLRIWDDEAKMAGLATSGMTHFAVHLRACALRAAQSA